MKPITPRYGYMQTRSLEAGLALVMLVIGLQLAKEGDTFSQPVYAVMREWISEERGGKLLAVVGLARFVALLVNGHLRETSLLRLLGCLVGFSFWSFFRYALERVPRPRASSTRSSGRWRSRSPRSNSLPWSGPAWMRARSTAYDSSSAGPARPLPNWGEVAPLLAVFFGVIGAIFGYGIQERRRPKALEETANPPAVMTAVPTGLEEKGKLALIHAQGEAMLTILTIVREDKRERERDDMVEEITGELRRHGIRPSSRTRDEDR